MTTAEAIKQIQFNLGKLDGVKTKLELSEKDLQQVIGNSLRELTTKMDTPAIVMVPFAPVIDLCPYKIAEIVFIMRSQAPAGVSMGAGLDPFYMSAIGGITTPGTANTHTILQTQAQYAIRAMAQNTVQTELQYMTDLYAKKLYVSYAGVQPQGLTIVYKPVLETVEDLPSDHWTTILLQLATAHSKIVLGNLRSKYSVSNSPVQINGSELVSQGKEELAKVYEQLKDSNLFFNLN